MPGKRRNRITVAASAEGVRRAERALVRHGFDNQSNFAKGIGIGRSSVTCFFNRNPVQVDTFKAICEALHLEYLEIMDERYFSDEPALEAAGQRVEVASTSQVEGKSPIVSASQNAQGRMIITVEGDLDPVVAAEITADLKKKYRLDVLNIQKGSIRIIVQGPEPESRRLIQQISDGEVEEIAGQTVQSVQTLSKELLASYFEVSGSFDSLELIRQILSGNFDKSTLAKADLIEADLSGANLSGADLSGVNLSGADLSRADLSRASLSGANLSGANLSGANLSGADLSRADLSGAGVGGANLTRADLSRADLSGANLSGANLSGADLSGADLTRADLNGANLTRADLTRADLSEAYVERARFINAIGITPELRTELELRGAIFIIQSNRPNLPWSFAMSDIQPLILQDEDGTTYTMYVETKTPVVIPPIPPSLEVDEDRESYGIAEDTVAKLKGIHGTIRAYAWYAIGAFKNFGGAEIEELNLKFGLKMGGKTGVPIVTEGSAEANFEISVKCKFPEPKPR